MKVNVKNNIRVWYAKGLDAYRIPPYVYKNCTTISEVCYMANNYIMNAWYMEIEKGDHISITDYDNKVTKYYTTRGRLISH